jgi:serine/threonine protein kinase
MEKGQRLGSYEIIQAIGAGGMGEVYKAHDTRLGRTVAIKVLKGQFSDRFEREARAISTLNHPNICTQYDVGPNYLVMEYIEGTPAKGPLPLDEALKVAASIADAMDAAHRQGIVHRDDGACQSFPLGDGLVRDSLQLLFVSPARNRGGICMPDPPPGPVRSACFWNRTKRRPS